MSSSKSQQLAPWFAGLVIVALCAANLLLLRQNLQLRAHLASKGAAIDATADSLSQGDLVANVSAIDLSGKPYELRYHSGKRHLLMFLSPSCGYCVNQAPLWRNVLNTIDPARFEVVGVVSNKEDQRAVSAHVDQFGYSKTKTTLPIVLFDQASLARYKLVGTPTTLLIDEEGKVERSWIGLWNSDVSNEVAAMLK